MAIIGGGGKSRLVSAVKGYFGWMYINGKVVVYVTQSLITKGDVDYGYIKRRYSVGPWSQTDILYHRPIKQKKTSSLKERYHFLPYMYRVPRCRNSLNRNAKLFQIFVMRNILINGLANQLLRLRTIFVRPFFVLRFNG